MQEPKRLPGEADPVPNAGAPLQVIRHGWMNADHGYGYGHGDPGIARAIAALLSRRRRKARKSR